MSQHFDDFIHVPAAGTSSGPGVSEVYFNNTEGKRVFTEGVIVTSIRARHPKYHLTVVPAYQCDLIAFAQDHPKEVSYKRRDVDQDLLERPFFPPPRRYNDEYGGAFVERVVFGCYDYTYRGTTFLLYVPMAEMVSYHRRGIISSFYPQLRVPMIWMQLKMKPPKNPQMRWLKHVPSGDKSSTRKF